MEEQMKQENTPKMEEFEEKARGYFREGLNCSECVMQTFLDLGETNLPQEVIALATGFGGGIGHTRNICGAISGAVMALSATKGRKNVWEKETPKERALQLPEIYAPFAEMIGEVKERYGTIICSELSAPMGAFEGKARKKNCQEIIGYAASLVAKYTENETE